MKKIIALFSVLAILFALASCSDSTQNATPSQTSPSETQEPTTQEPYTFPDGITIYGSDTQKHHFVIEIIKDDGSKSRFGINTDAEFLGDALEKLSIIATKEGSNEIITVNGITKDYNKDGIHWVLYVNEELAQANAFEIPCETGSLYTLRLEK